MNRQIMSAIVSYVHCIKALSNVQCTEARLCVPITVLCFEAIPSSTETIYTQMFPEKILESSF